MADSGSTIATIVIQSRENFPLANNVGDQGDWMVLARAWLNRAFSGDSLGGFGQAYASASAVIGATAAAASLTVQDGAVAASNTLTFSAHATAADTVTIGGVVFTAETSGATGNQWNIGASATASATNLAVAINASADVMLGVYAETVAGVLTITSLIPGKIGNLISLATTSSQITIGGSGSALEGGTSNATVTYNF